MIHIVDVHLIFDEKISLINTHHVGNLVKKHICMLNGEIRWIMTIHLNPKDNSAIWGH